MKTLLVLACFVWVPIGLGIAGETWLARRPKRLLHPLRRFHVSKTMAPISFTTELLADYGITDPEAEGFVRDEMDMGWRLEGRDV